VRIVVAGTSLRSVSYDTIASGVPASVTAIFGPVVDISPVVAPMCAERRRVDHAQ
jgi:hypothetical protein